MLQNKSMVLLYKAGIFFYSLMIHVFSVFNEKAKLFVKGRKNWEEQLTRKIKAGEKYIWFHCASLGEFEQGRPVIEELKLQFPEYKVVLTFFSSFGLRNSKKLSNWLMLYAYLPLDTKSNAEIFLNIIKPEKAFFVKYEFWYFYISELKNRKIPLYIISAIFREKQHVF